ncbi:MAG TPA: bifunctional phosphoglucose/phosphomannose isomerase, partial [bacterium (Candidatus Stahlbacteria)]|nr:bifunctional phosphoglucose/phosphomannose isomerase [Candidatus Stahlbacteria bacterium]
GSAIGGDLLESCLREEISIPIYVNRDYGIPGFVSQSTLAFICSYSGNTEETLSAYQEISKHTKNIVCITTGGKLEELCNSSLIKIPKGLQPRCAIGYLFVPMLVLLSRFDIISEKDTEIKETISLLSSLSKRLTKQGSIAYKIAKDLQNKLPIIYASNRLGVCARRWVTQLNENSKTMAHFNLFSELNHNEIVGFGTPNLSSWLVILRDRDDGEKIARRIELTKEIITPYTVGISEVWSEGKSLLARLFSIIYVGDWVSYWLAIMREVDPTPVDRIDYLKRKLKS